ncbi:MAG TPA: CHAP domain-containing protein [Solirubrobacteraceae bacterium]|nr:CHAP domain-containing protein [Solirubrobacteraceae bacterium]
MSIESAFARIAELQSLLGGVAPTAPAPATSTTGAPSSDQFAHMLRAASLPGAAGPTATTATGAPIATGAAGAIAPAATPAGNTPAARMVALAQAEVGVAEQPPGSNNSPRIAQYRSATAGAPGPGPWCAYFTSWLARQAGVPVGEHGQGFGSVDALYAWAQRSGRAFSASSGQDPRPGDLIVWDEHIGIVESVRPDGSVQTIEGNSSDRVSRRVHATGSALGYVRMS